MARSEVIVYKGIKYRRYPESDRWPDRVYFTPSGNHRKAGVGRLHQEIYKDHNGPIPDGYHVHHDDHDPLNNDPANLVLVKGSEHLSHHVNQPERIAKSRVNIEIAREYASAWHGSEEGLAWHVENGKKVWEMREPSSHVCDQCGKGFELKIIQKSGVRFCSNNCKSAWRRAAGLDNVDRTCVECGASFTVNKYMKTPTCSRSCGVKRGRRLGKERRLASAA
jgi:hypothetical protein